MKIVTLPHNIWVNGSELRKGTPYLMEDNTAGVLMTRMVLDVQNYHYDYTRTIVNDTEKNSVLIIRPGGIGDLLFLTPCMLELKRTFPTVAVACMPEYQEAIEGLHFVTPLSYPLPMEEVRKFSEVVLLENSVEMDPAAHNVHMVDYFSKILGVHPHRGMRGCLVDFELAELETAEANFPKSEKKRIGIQVQASAAARTYPFELTKKLIGMITEAGMEVMLFGAPGSMMSREKNVICLPEQNPRIGIRESFALLTTCDCVVAPDSAICHAAGALSLPTVALYGPFPADTRVKYHPSVKAITGGCPISPCFHHERGSEFPENGPCHRSKKCEALASITPEMIFNKIKELC